jgi:hypothetical protein
MCNRSYEQGEEEAAEERGWREEEAAEERGWPAR